MNSRIKVDRISSLPNNIIDSILTRLEIKEAVRTSILSQSWRYHWHSLSKIVIKRHDLPQVSRSAAAKIVDNILLLHCGSIHKFELSIDFEICNDMDRWIMYVSRNGIKELIINRWVGKYYNLPSCLFSCSDLTRLLLYRCVCKPPPAAFKAFSNLSVLLLGSVVIAEKVLANLLNSCPHLSQLFLVEVSPRPSLEINAPNLVRFLIQGFCCYPHFKNTPLLTNVYFGLASLVSSHIANNKDCKIVELLGSMPSLQKLEFDGLAFQHFAVGDIPARLPVVCPIKHLMLPINFEDLQELVATFCIFRSSHIRILNITACSDKNTSRISADGFWNGEEDFNFKFDHLQEVELYCFTRAESELKFVELLLANAPSLETMKINFQDNTNIEVVLTIVAKLIQFPRISPKAQLKLNYD